MNRHLILVLGIAFILSTFTVSCGENSTGPEQNGEPVLTAGEVTHFHCDLSWTQVDLESQDHISYNLYRSQTKGISSDTTQAELIATFANVDELTYSDSLIVEGTDYYFALLTQVTESGSDASEYLWSNEITVQSHDVNYVTFVNNSGSTLYIMSQQGGWEGHPEAGPWLTDIGEHSKWAADGTAFSTDFVTSCPTGDTLDFIYPEYSIVKPHGARIYIGETQFDGAPDLQTYPHIYDKIEAGWGAGNTWNTTCVGFVAIPLQLHGNGLTVGFLSSVTRSALFDSLAALPSPYGDLGFPASNPVRFFSPGKWSESSQVAHLLDSALVTGLPLAAQDDWRYSADLYTDVTYTPPDQITASSNGGTSTASSITTLNVFGCCIPNSGDGGPMLAALIGAAASRGVLHNYAWWGDHTKYYQSYSENHGQYNYFSGLLHDLSIDGLCYGMPYDDYYDRHSGIIMNPGNSIMITILPFN